MVLSELRNLAPKSAARHKVIGIRSLAAMRQRRAIDVFIDLKTKFPDSISLNFLYAITSALENRNWRQNTSNKGALLTDLESRMAIIQTLGP